MSEESGSTVLHKRKGARKRKGKPVKIDKDCYQEDSSDEEYTGEEDNKKDSVRIENLGKRKLMIRWSSQKKVSTKIPTENEDETKDDSPGSSFVNVSTDSHSNHKNSIATEVGCNTEDPLNGGCEQPSSTASSLPRQNKSSAHKANSRTEYHKTWYKNRTYHCCPSCDYKTRDRDTFNSHLAKHDPNAERFVCEVCSKSFRNKRSYLWHLRVHETPEQLHYCNLCSYRTPQRSAWLRHLNEVHKVDPEGNPLSDDFKCNECDFVCVSEYKLKLHRKAKHCEKQHKCSECSYSAISKCDVEKHVSIIHRNERKHLCSECGYMAKTVSALNDHARGHLGLKSFVCNVCGKAYARGDKLKIHLRTHSGNLKPYICPFCMHAWNRKDHFKVHLKRVHKSTLENDNLDSLKDIGQQQPVLTMSLSQNDNASTSACNSNIISLK